MSRSKKYYYTYSAEELFTKIKTVYNNKYYNLFMNSLKWNNLTKEEEDYIMRKLWSMGTIAAFNMKDFGTVYAPYAVQGYGLYDVPTDVNIINERNIPGFPINPLKVNKDAVIGYIQRNKKPIRDIVDYYVTRLAQVEMVINTNLELQKIPFLIGISDTDTKNAQEIVNKILNNEVVVFANMEEINQVKALVNGAPYILDKLYAFKNNLESELLTYLGIDNSQVDVDKLAVDQINANNQMINNNSQGYINELTKWCEDVKKYLGTEISVEATQQPVESVHQDMDHSKSNMEDKSETGGTL